MAIKKKKGTKFYPLPKSITTVTDVADFFDHLLYERELSFHPDDRFEDYVTTATGKRCFTDAEARKYNAMMERSFTVCQKADRDIYSIGLKKMMNRFKEVEAAIKKIKS